MGLIRQLNIEFLSPQNAVESQDHGVPRGIEMGNQAESGYNRRVEKSSSVGLAKVDTLGWVRDRRRRWKRKDKGIEVTRMVCGYSFLAIPLAICLLTAQTNIPLTLVPEEAIHREVSLWPRLDAVTELARVVTLSTGSHPMSRSGSD